MKKSERIIESCKSIMEFLVSENDRDVRELKYADFLHKFSFLEKMHSYKIQTKKRYDIIIFVVVKVELEALDKILSFKENGRRPEENFNNIHCWEYDLDRGRESDTISSSKPEPLKLLIVFLGEAGDINCSIACMRIYSLCECQLAILSGIAAGHEDEIKKYSVVISNGVIDYEPQRIEKDGKIVFRPNNYDVDSRSLRDVTFLETEDTAWRHLFLQEISKWEERIQSTAFDISQLSKSELKAGVIASGKKLLADTHTLNNLRHQLTYKKGIIAAEMEGGGFCPASKEFQINWLVIRGISDYGGDDKDNTQNKAHQFAAAVAAMTATVFYLKYIYRRANEPGGSLEEF